MHPLRKWARALWVSTLGFSLMLFNATSIQAGELFGGVEISGHIDVVTGWQHDDGNTLDYGSCSFGVGGLGCNAVDSIGSGYGELGNFRGLGAPNRDTYNFYLDEVELDIQSIYGENIRLRADIDLGRFLSGTPNTGGTNTILEQGYVTVNIPLGHGAEMLIGRFNAPIGRESVDRIDNTAISFSNIYRYVRPHNLTGVKFYYAFSDLIDWNLYIVNNLADTFSFAVNTDSAIPSYGTRIGFTFGPEDRPNTLGLSYAGGPENYGHNSHLTHIVDLDFTLRPTERITVGGEAIYRQDNTNFITPTGISFIGLPNSKVWGGNVLLGYEFGEAWNFWFRYGYLHDLDVTGAYSGLDQQIHTFTVGTAYQVIEGAKIKLEYRADLRHYASTQLAGIMLPGGLTSTSHGIAAEFGYEF